MFAVPAAHGTLLTVLFADNLEWLVGVGTLIVPNNKDRHDKCDVDHIRSVSLAHFLCTN